MAGFKKCKYVNYSFFSSDDVVSSAVHNTDEQQPYVLFGIRQLLLFTMIIGKINKALYFRQKYVRISFGGRSYLLRGTNFSPSFYLVQQAS